MQFSLWIPAEMVDAGWQTVKQVRNDMANTLGLGVQVIRVALIRQGPMLEAVHIDG